MKFESSSSQDCLKPPPSADSSEHDELSVARLGLNASHEHGLGQRRETDTLAGFSVSR